jgi:hypothetical protein
MGTSWISNPTAGTRRFFRTADFQVCRIAGFPTRRPFANLARPTRTPTRRMGNPAIQPVGSVTRSTQLANPDLKTGFASPRHPTGGDSLQIHRSGKLAFAALGFALPASGVWNHREAWSLPKIRPAHE